MKFIADILGNIATLCFLFLNFFVQRAFYDPSEDCKLWHVQAFIYFSAVILKNCTYVGVSKD